ESSQRALKISQKVNSPLLRARILANIAAIYVKEKNLDAADKAADSALALLGNANDGVWGVKAEIEFDRGNIGKAKEYITRAFGGPNPDTTPSIIRETHEIAFKIYMAAGDTAHALAHHIAFKQLDDEARALAASTNSALMTAQFDFAHQQFEIEHLRAEKLKRDVAVAQERARAQMTLFSSILLIGIVIIIAIGIGYVGLRRHRNQIRRANVKLQSTIGELDNEIVRRKETESELRIAKNEAERASHSKTQFLANMSHELRTPLNAIIGFAEMMFQEMLGSIGTPTYKTYAKDIMDSGQHLLAILNDILDMARIDAGRAELTESEVDLGSTISHVLRMFQEPTRTGGKVIQFREPDIPVSLFADERLIRQILINLVSNAVKFTGAEGRVEIRLEWPKDGGVDLVVADNGVGIPADKIAHVMERFGQVENALSRTRGGIGLGLPIVKALAELHGGTLAIESAQGKGTVVRVHLPEDRVLKSANLEPAFG
ncbi:MAG: ATP-binding protein, partial [Alphaproteobacteria bacterium]